MEESLVKKRLENNDDVVKENYRIYNQIQKLDKYKKPISVLDQKGPKSLNYINKIQEERRVDHVNNILLDKIVDIKSDYSIYDPNMISHFVGYEHRRKH